MSKTPTDEELHRLKTDTKLATGGRDPFAHHGYVNPPVYHASTLLYPTAEDYLAHRGRYQYGRRGTPTSEALENAVKAIEGPSCAGVSLLPSGLAAISSALLAVLHSGDHLLVTDSAYAPTRKFCNDVLTRYGVSTTYYDPLIGSGIEALMQPNTRAVFTEAPGSLSFEMQDIPADRRDRPPQERPGADGQYLGKPALFSCAGTRRRYLDPVRHQIHRRSLRPDARHGVLQRANRGRRCATRFRPWACALARTI